MEPRIIPREEHPFSRSLVDPDVLRVLYRLKHEGFEAYIVGGAVRDILRGGTPKDFDVATNATPMELRRIFRNSRIIGRRFRLVHVFYGDKNIEVATLRRYKEAGDGNGVESDHEGDLYIDDDNNWGNVESDSFRRDFTINALYYDIRDFAIVDYTGGVDDVRAGVVRSVGDPWVRFQEDPVRMLRAVKFAARFGFRIEPETASALAELPHVLQDASRPRITEEVFRILTQANRHTGLDLLRRYGLLEAMFPTWVADLGEEGLDQVVDYFDEVERHAAEGRFVPLELLAAGLFAPMLDTVDPEAEPYHDHAARLSDDLRRIGHEMDLPKRLMVAVQTILRGQLYLLHFVGRPKSMRRFVENEEFDWVWRFHLLAFGHLDELAEVRSAWVAARAELPSDVGGWVDVPDRRDIFSFRGDTGGGRRRFDEPATIFDPQTGHHVEPDEAPSHQRRRRRRR
jgi:poly(A) polymerase